MGKINLCCHISAGRELFRPEISEEIGGCMEKKPWYLSKMVWLSLFGLVAVVIPQSAEFIKENLSEAGGVFMAANFFLRVFHTGKAIE